MAVKFIEPGGDTDFNWPDLWPSGSLTSPVTDFVHGSHLRSLQYRPSNLDNVSSANGIIQDAGARISIYFYFVALPNATASIFNLRQSGGSNTVLVRMTSGGVLQLWNGTTAQIGTNGATLVTGRWYRISLAYTITSTTVNRFELFVDSISSISITNATITNTATSFIIIGNNSVNTTFDFRSSDHYIDDSSALTDPGDVWVTVKRPNANGTNNDFTTQIGSGGSGYGSGHSPQVNERPGSVNNGWSITTSSIKIEEYNIESKGVGDTDITGLTIVDYMGWVSASATTAETGKIVLNGVDSDIALASGQAFFVKMAGSSTYPAGTGTDIGVKTSTTSSTVKLFECGIVFAHIGAGSPVTLSISVNESITVSESKSIEILGIKFLEPGGDATFSTGFFSPAGSPTVSSSVVHGGHQRSLQIPSDVSVHSYLNKSGVLADIGRRISAYFLFDTIPNGNLKINPMEVNTVGLSTCFGITLTTAGNIAIYDKNNTIQATGSKVLSINNFYRISLVYTITSASVNTMSVYINGALEVTASNITVTVSSDTIAFGFTETVYGATGVNFYLSDIYIDDQTSGDTGDVWVTAKRPNANGTVNNFNTQIGAGGSGYGSGHSPQVNERPLSATNGWSVVAAGITTEEYNVESISTGDIDITGTTLIESMGWISTKALVAETGQIIVNNVASNISITTSQKIFTKVAGFPIYPAGTGTDIGMNTSSDATTVSLYECGIVIAYIPPIIISVNESVTVSENLKFDIAIPFSLFDTVSIAENVSVKIPILYVSPSELIFIGELFLSLGDRAFSSLDIIMIFENVNVYIPVLYLSIFDSVSVSENTKISYSLPSPITDSVSVSESMVIEIVNSSIDFESVTISENIRLEVVYVITTSESVTVTDTVMTIEPFISTVNFPLPIGSTNRSQGITGGGDIGVL